MRVLPSLLHRITGARSLSVQECSTLNLRCVVLVVEPTSLPCLSSLAPPPTANVAAKTSAASSFCIRILVAFTRRLSALNFLALALFVASPLPFHAFHAFRV